MGPCICLFDTMTWVMLPAPWCFPGEGVCKRDSGHGLNACNDMICEDSGLD